MPPLQDNSVVESSPANSTPAAATTPAPTTAPPATAPATTAPATTPAPTTQIPTAAPLPTPNITELAARFAPSLRFDSAAGSDQYCFPSSAEDYYTARVHRFNGSICNLNYTLVEGGRVPTYWHAQECGDYLHIGYWSFFGWNEKCDCCSGNRNAWFESLVVKVQNYTLNPSVQQVRFGQKDGWYTKVAGHYQTVNGSHPVAYVGKASHGFYHDDGGSGSCCYWEDYRDTGSHVQHLDAWQNLVSFDNTTEWIMDPNPVAWSGIYSPRWRGDWDLCKLNGCSGAEVALCEDSGCYKSDINNHPF